MGAQAKQEQQSDLGVVYGMSPAAYHADPCSVPSLTASIAHVLVAKSPQHAWLMHPRLGGKRRDTTRGMEMGTIAHALLLGTEHDLVVVEADDWRSKAAKDLRDAAAANGKVPCLRRDLEEAETAVKGIRSRLRAAKLKLSGKSEVSIFWSEEADDGSIVQCRGRLDHLVLAKQRAFIYDLKSCRSAHPRACRSHAYEYGYDIQAAAYSSAIAKVLPKYAGRCEFRFLFAELEEPYALTPCVPSGAMRELGERRWRRAINSWAQCTAAKKWPGYAEGLVQLEAPPWALAEEEEIIYGSTNV